MKHMHAYNALSGVTTDFQTIKKIKADFNIRCTQPTKCVVAVSAFIFIAPPSQREVLTEGSLALYRPLALHLGTI